MTGTWRTMFIAFLGLFHKVYPCGMLSGIVISTTKVSEFLSAMNRVHAPKNLVIPLAVMLRYIPTIQEDWRFIKDAMRPAGRVAFPERAIDPSRHDRGVHLCPCPDDGGIQGGG